jgi:hypothetical protein
MANLDGSRDTGRGHGGPESPLNLDSIFPMKDEASARLMMVKADCLRAAGLIDDAERQTIVTRAISILAADEWPNPKLTAAAALARRAGSQIRSQA